MAMADEAMRAFCRAAPAVLGKRANRNRQAFMGSMAVTADRYGTPRLDTIEAG